MPGEQKADKVPVPLSAHVKKIVLYIPSSLNHYPDVSQFKQK
jgi:hypothetical protein